jgi:diguanylate cyclase (GGDEF)-like protein
LLDHTSLVLTIALLAACQAGVLLAGWLIARTEAFLALWASGLFVLALGMGLFMLHIGGPHPHLAAPAFCVLLAGFSIIEGAGWQFHTGRPPAHRILAVAGSSAAIVTPFFLLGLTGIGTSLVNALAGAILISAGLGYWKARSEAPTLIPILTGLYVAVALSFLICAVVILIESPLYRVRTPNNWAENLNALAAIIGLAGIGAVSLALNHARLVQSLTVASRTDPLTGLYNRRALFELHGTALLPVGTAVAAFDLDHFKSINDRYGHAVGDEVLRRFAQLLLSDCGRDAVTARIGGEEFVAILRNTAPLPAQIVVNRIRDLFSGIEIETGQERLRCTVSAGLSFATSSKRSLSSVLHEADMALYQAKKSGRNCVCVNGRLLAA